ncbi:MAG: hypothetical protein FWG50_06500 [Kiritimatiellaeota bacterium]|nr:hypothetical protein [Kiritimatiellota bacterium]
MKKLFGTDGIRGQANRYPVNADLALRLGKALGIRLKSHGHDSTRVVIGCRNDAGVAMMFTGQRSFRH